MTCICKDRRDVEAVAKARLARAEGKQQAYWMGGCLIVALAGVMVPGIPKPMAWVLMLGAMIILLWQMNKFSNRQKAAAAQLIREWEQGQK